VGKLKQIKFEKLGYWFWALTFLRKWGRSFFDISLLL
jgi:hypothetical protein